MEEEKTNLPAPQEPVVEKTTENQVEPEPPVKEEPEPQEEKTSEQIESLQAQKEHWREKAEKAQEELTRLKDKEPSTPPEEALKNENPDWEFMSDNEKKLLREQHQTQKELTLIKEKLAWEEDYGKAKKEFPQLSKKEDEFKEFCYKYPKGLDATTLAKAFLFDNKVEPAEPEKPVSKPGLEKPTGGQRTQKPDLSMEDIKRLRETNHRKYLKMIQDGTLRVPSE